MATTNSMADIPAELRAKLEAALKDFYGQEAKKNAARIKELEAQAEQAKKDLEQAQEAFNAASKKYGEIMAELNGLRADENKIRRQAEAAARAALGAKAPRAPRSNGKSSEVRNTKYLVKYVNGDGELREIRGTALTDYSWALNRIDSSVPQHKAPFLDELHRRSGIRPFSAEHEEAPNKTLTAKFDKITVHVILL